MKKTNKLISILLVLAMFLSMVPLSLTAFAATPTPYDGVPVTPMEIHTGNYRSLGLTQESFRQYEGYYAIRNAKELYGYAELVKGIYSMSYSYDAVLLQDIVVNTPGSTTYKWTPIATGTDYFWEVFDGNGHSISGLYCTDVIVPGMTYYSFTSFIAFLDEGTVKNLVIKDSTFSSDAYHVAGITGLNYGTVENCRVESSVTVSSSNTEAVYSFAGGIVAENEGSVANCVSYASVSGGYSNGKLTGGGNGASNSYSSASSHNCANISATHQQINATCYYPGRSYYSFCLVCDSVTSGTKIDTDVAGHKWEEATCTEPPYCDVCGKSNGTPNGHKNLRYITDEATGRYAEYLCDVCGTVGTVTLSSQHVDYDGNPHGATVTYTGNFPKVTVNYKNRDTGAISTEAPTEAGSYDAYFAVGAFQLTTTYIINKRAIDGITAPTPNTLTYNGKAQALVSAGEANGGEIQYSLDGVTYSADIPVATNAGDYTVYYKVIGDNNHKDTEPATVTVTINKKSVTASATVQDKVYDGTTNIDASAIEITFDGIVDGDDFEVANCVGMFLSPNAGNNKTIYVAYNVSGEDVDNYDFHGDYIYIPESEYYRIETKANILPRDISNAEIVLGNSLTYNGAEQTQTVTAVTVDGLDVTYTVNGNISKNVGVYLLTVTGTGNFSGEATALYEIAVDVSGLDYSEIDGYFWSDVKSTDKDRLEYVYNQINNAEWNEYADAEKRAEWNELRGNCYEMLLMIKSVTSHLENLKEEVAGYDIDTVTSADYDYLEGLYESEAQWLDDFTENYTDEEIEEFSDTLRILSKLTSRIFEVTNEYNRVIAAANGYDEATVTSDDKDTLVQLNADIYALALTDNVTADEKAVLQSAHDKVFGLIEKITYISEEIKRIIEAVDKYVFESVKSSDKADIQQLIADIKALLDTQNITADERTLLEAADETCDKLIAKIDETVAEINRINDATNAYDIDTVTSADKANIEKLIADIKVLTDGDNINDVERNQLNSNDATLDALLEKIAATADEIARIDEAVNSYAEATVKSTDKADLEQLVADIKALTDATNITEDERTALEALDEKADALIKKIDDTAAEIARIDEAVNSYDSETVTSDDVPALGELIEDIKVLTDATNITDDERAALEANDEAIDELVEKLTEVAEEIKRVDEAVKSYGENTVKSTDKDDLAQLKEDVQALIDSGNTTKNEKTVLEDMITDIEGLEGKIEEIEQQLEDIAGIENGYDPETVKSDDKAAIKDTIAEIEAVNPDNLTDEQKAEYSEIKASLEELLNEIAAAEKQVKDMSTKLAVFDEKTATIFKEEEINALIIEINELLADSNMGEKELEKLNSLKEQSENLIEVINNPCEYFSLRFFYLIWDCLTWKYNGIIWIFSKIFGC